ncbi:MAG: hypothetical protein UY76_C0014G0008 [Candidatus Uhrbacteria bacterium GW2011_GWA2_52_8d]|uniref:DUF2283 domain-containing protein n=1 Tax=Candidatus Uhrbacteria bacterium GW2011_GWA2_52_8d TaxID=1618979 RepID=A0A0G1XPU0_9BACT|nr:MAG: hypothetical protein UY76_C0014G0008 [Candidatus Uhrbacteria bacterium GW2011_GWA2_52_8d]
MKIEYDREADAIYVHLMEKPKKVARSREIEQGVILDLDTKKQVIGIEVLEVSKRFKEADAFQFGIRHISKSRLVA